MKNPKSSYITVCPHHLYNRQDIWHIIIDRDGKRDMLMLKRFRYRGNNYNVSKCCVDIPDITDKDSPIIMRMYEHIDQAVQRRIGYENLNG